MRVIRTVFLLCAGATIFWTMQHRDQMQQGHHSSLSSVLAQAGNQLPSALTRAGDQLPSVFAQSGTSIRAPRSATSEQIFFSPGEDLERVDVRLIDSAHSSIKVAMYAFTDRTIAQALARKAASGVQVWVYRDREQFEQEQARRSQVTAILSGQRNIHVRVKGSNELMHQKIILIDNRVLRDGSGNWSVSAARFQDNQVTLTQDALQIEAFDRDFTEMWRRGNNLVVQ